MNPRRSRLSARLYTAGGRRRETLSAFALVLLSMLLAGAPPQALAAPPTNVVVIMADDLSSGMLADALDAGLMPNLKSEVVDVGLEFTESFVTDPLCCPSRATFLSGQYVHNHGVRTNSYPRGGVTFFNDASSLATWLHDGGVVTGLVGKYLNGYGRNETSLPNDDPTYIPPGWSDWQGLVDPSTYRVYNYRINDNGTVVQYGSAPQDYQTDVLARRATEFLRDLPGTGAGISVPFFLWITPLAPHSEDILAPCSLPDQPLKLIRPAPRHEGLAAAVALPKPPSFNEADILDKPAWFRAAFPHPYDDAAVSCLEANYHGRMESLAAIDDLVGAVIRTLDKRQALGNTVVIFTSDNGYLFGEHRFASKLLPYEESIRVPLYFRIPNQQTRRTESALALNNDLAPTVAEILDVRPGLVVDGRSLVPFLEGAPPADWRELFLVEGYATSDDSVSIPGFAALRTGPLAPYPNRLHATWNDGSVEYYDLAVDPYQISNPSGPLNTRARRWIAQRRDALRTCAGPSCQTYENW